MDGYEISSELVAAIAEAGGLLPRTVERICTYDWPEGQDHQDWLSSAPVAEIATWAAIIARDEDAMMAQESGA